MSSFETGNAVNAIDGCTGGGCVEVNSSQDKGIIFGSTSEHNGNRPYSVFFVASEEAVKEATEAGAAAASYADRQVALKGLLYASTTTAYDRNTGQEVNAIPEDHISPRDIAGFALRLDGEFMDNVLAAEQSGLDGYRIEGVDQPQTV
jgi:hypothetical protein